MPDSLPQTPDEAYDSEPATPGSVDESSEASTPLDPPSSGSETGMFAAPAASGMPRRVPSLRTVSDPQGTAHMSPSSTVSGTLNNARRPPPSAGGLPMDIMQRAMALQQQRMGMPRPNLSQPGAASDSGSSVGGPRGMGGAMGSPMGGPMGGPRMGGPMGGPMAGGLPGNLKLPPNMGNMARPMPPGFPQSAPVVPGVAGRKPGLSERRAAMKLGGLPGAPGTPPVTSAPKLSDMKLPPGADNAGGNGGGAKQDSKLNDFKNYIDADKGWITFEGAATITRTGVNFASGQKFSISLDEIDVMDELGKGNYGTVYKVRHARPRVPRFGQGLSGFKSVSRQNSSLSEKDDSSAANSPLSPTGSSKNEATSGVVMAMKEIRLELEESKFTTILKELVILHQCVSPYIIDFYGAFFQEGAVYMCIEYMDGGSLDKLYAGGIPEPVLHKITYSTVMGLKTLKEDHNIIHRDVKPTNILVNSEGKIKICDFGVSGNLVASIAKTNIGCQSYMAPERISGGGMSAAGANAEGTYSVQSDIWSLGLTIIECAMGAYPYPPNVSSSIFSQLSAIVEGDPPDLPTEGYSTTARDFVRSCLNKNPKKRPTYPMLLLHPWMKALSKPATIAEDDEEQEDGSELAASLDTKLSLAPGGGDPEVAAWVKDVMDKKRRGELPKNGEKPALHAAPLDAVSPAASPTASPLAGGG